MRTVVVVPAAVMTFVRSVGALRLVKKRLFPTLPALKVPELGEMEAVETMTANASQIAFLWDAYLPEFWYWEVVETTRRLMLTAVLSVCGPGSATQAVLAVLLSIAYIELYNAYKPFAEQQNG